MASKVSGLIEKIQTGGSSGTTHAIASTAYGYCETAADEAAKTVDMTGFKLYEGVTIHVKFKENNSAASPTLNVLGTGAKPIVSYGTTVVSSNDNTNSWYAGAVLSLTYDGTSWVKSLAVNTNTWRGIVDNLTSSTATTTSLSGKLGYLLANGDARDNTKLPLDGGTMTGNILGNSSVALGTAANPFHNIVLGGTTNATMTAASANPRITFQENTGTQPVHLIYTDLDAYRAPAGLKIIGGTSATPAWLEVEGNIYAAAFKGKATSAYHASAAHWYTLAGTPTGILKIKIKKKQGWMLAFTVRVYQAYCYDDYVISGYNYGSNKWYAAEATLLASESTEKHTVTFGYDDDTDSNNFCTLWVSIPVKQYTGIDIFNVTNGYSQITDISDTFEIIQETTSTGTVQTTVDCYRPWYRNEKVSSASNADNATAATTAEAFSSGTTVKLTGDTTGESSSSTKGWIVATTTNALTATPTSSLNTQELIDGFLEANKLKYGLFKTSEANNIGMALNDGMLISMCWGSTTYGVLLALDDNTAGIMKFRGKTTNWGDWKTVAHSGNVSTGDNNGQIKIAGTNVSVKGLASLAYKDSLTTADIPDLGSTYLKLTGGTLTGNTYFKSSTGDQKFYITRLGGTSESAGMWVDDAYFHIDVCNDETTANILFKLYAADTKASDGTRAQTSYVNFTGSNGKSTVTADYFSGNGASLTSLNGSNISSGTVADARIATTIARLASPAFTGTPTAPTATNGTSTTLIATTEFVRNTLSYVNAMLFKGTLGTGGTVATLPDTHEAGDTYRVITAGTWAGKYCEVGTLIICVKDGTAASNDDWTSVETNEDGAVIGPSSSTGNNIVTFSGNTGRIILDSGKAFSTATPESSSTDALIPTAKAVWTAINALDANLNSTTPGAGKTLTAFSLTDGKVSATFEDISITESLISDLKSYLPLSGGIMTGNIRRYYASASTEPMITALANNVDIYLFQVGHGGVAATNLGNNGYKLLYKGKNDSTNNYLQIVATKSDGAEVIAALIDEIGNIVLSATAASTSTTSGALKVAGGLGVAGQVTAARLAANGSNTSYNLYVNGSSYLNGNTNTKNIYHLNGNAIEDGSWITGATGTAPTATTTDGNTTYSGAVIGTSILTLGNNKVGANSASGVNNNAQGYLRLYSSGSAYAQITAYSGDKTRLYPEEGISIPTDKVGIMFRPTSGSYYTHFSYLTANNEALVMATLNAVTSFIFINGESYANVSNTRWRSLTPALQIKNNSVIIGKLIDTEVTPSYKFEVNGTTYINGATTINSTTQINNTLTLYREGTTSANSPARITFTVKDTDKNTSNTGYIAYYHDHTTTYNGNLVINSSGGTFIGAGESASTLYTALGSTSSTENLYLTADNVVYVYAYADTAANRIGFAINTSGHIVPLKAEGKNNNVQNLGASDNKWANIYVTTVTSIAASLTSATSTTANTVANATLILGNSANVNSTTAHSEGEIVLYSAATAAHTIKGSSTTTAYTHTLPNDTGLLVSLSDGTAKGSSTKPIYIPATGIVTECSTYAGGTKVTLNNSDKGASSAAFYAPTSGGTAGQPLIGAGTTTEPAWYGGLTLSGSAAATWVASFAGTTASTTTTSGAVKVAGGLGVAGQVTALRLAANGSNTSYSLYVNGTSYLKGATTIDGDLSFTHTNANTPGYITWSSGSYLLRIFVQDDATANTAVFTFQQNANTGTTYTNLFTIYDNKSVATDRYNYTVSDVIKAYTEYNSTDDSIDFIFA